MTRSSETPWNLLGDSSVFCSNKATLGGLLDGFGKVTRETKL